MKKRILSAIIIILLVVPLVLAGGKVFAISVGLLAMLALKEFIDLKKSHTKIPGGLILFSVIMLVILVFFEYEGQGLSYGISHRFLILLLLGYLVPTLFHSKERQYETKDAFYLFGIVIFLGVAFNSLIILRMMNLYLLGYLILIPIFTDTFAYIVGSLIGKRKIAPLISPNKTVEGSIAGTLVGTIIGSIYYYYFIAMDSIIFIIILSLILSIAGQFGDLLFSKIKRENDIKDFSNLIPGHGGVLDRLDSFIFTLLVYVLFLRFF